MSAELERTTPARMPAPRPEAAAEARARLSGAGPDGAGREGLGDGPHEGAAAPLIGVGMGTARRPLWPWVLAGSGCLMVPALLNGMPFVYYDSVAYVTLPDGVLPRLQGGSAAPTLPAGEAGAEAASAAAEVGAGAAVAEAAPEHVRGRSPVYRLAGWGVQWLGLGLWPLIAAQALAVSTVLGLLWRVALPRLSGWLWLAGLAILTLLTPLGLFTGLVMPDIFAGLLVVATGLLALGWPWLTPGQRWFLGLLAGFAMTVHLSHAAVALLLLCALGLAGLVHRGLRQRRRGAAAVVRPDRPCAAVKVAPAGLAVLVLGLAAALAVEAAVVAAHARLSDRPLLTRPHVTANLVDRGPGTAYLQRACPEAGFVLCDHLDRLPIFWIAFLFETDPEHGMFAALGPAERQALSAEHGRFVRAVIADDPGDFLRFAVGALGAQLVRFGAADAVIGVHSIVDIAALLPPQLGHALADSGVMRHHDAVMSGLDAATLGLVALSLAVLLTAGLRHHLPAGGPAASSDFHANGPSASLAKAAALPGPVVGLVWVILAGIVANAAVCGILAAPYDRFQARVIWLLPLAALMLLTISRSPAPRQKADR